MGPCCSYDGRRRRERLEDEALNAPRPSPDPNAASLAASFEVVRPRLELVECFIADQLGGGPELVREAGGYVLQAGGKRLRPAILLTVSRLLGYHGDLDLRYGAIVEMIHTATLVHDDIIDSATVRRGRARIAPVYTPPGHRRRGFGSAATAAAVHSAWRAGAVEVTLFTDAEYPAANEVYRRLGFEVVGEFAEFDVPTS